MAAALGQSLTCNTYDARVIGFANQCHPKKTHMIAECLFVRGGRALMGCTIVPCRRMWKGEAVVEDVPPLKKKKKNNNKIKHLCVDIRYTHVHHIAVCLLSPKAPLATQHPLHVCWLCDVEPSTAVRSACICCRGEHVGVEVSDPIRAVLVRAQIQT